ncbi:MAG: PASTA domain-containing protein [Erysipelotrichaceae bacterium]|nr:PASTA domain-containing protein [Erysipelotrichaceae bacterium]
MADKDFLSQFSDANKPESFKEEERIPVVKEKKKVNPLLLGIAIALLLAIAVLLYFLFLAPKIAVPDFVGKNKSDVAAWVRQQGIEASGIVFDETYDFDTEEGTVLSQNVAAGKKVKKDVKMNFVLSLGPDPDEAIRVPDLSGMTKSEVQEWISRNKLSKTKVVTAYNDSVEEDGVISYSFSGCEEDSFTRACSLKISVSKGPAPAGKVTVEDFEKKLYETVEAWAKSKKIELSKSETYSDKVEAGYVISQSIESGKTINEGDTLHVVVSLGKAISIPNMYGWTRKEVENWCRKNGVAYDDSEEDYDTTNGLCIKQSINPGSIVKEGDIIYFIISKGDPDISEFYGTTLDELKAWVEKINIESARVTLNKPVYDFSDSVPAGNIISLSKKVKTGGSIDVVISKGKNVYLNDTLWDTLRTDPHSLNEEDVRNLFNANPDISFVFRYEKNESLENSVVLSASRSDGKQLENHTYLPQSESIVVVVNDKGE